MIFVPKKEKAIIWNYDDINHTIHIFYPLNDNCKLKIIWYGKNNEKFQTYNICIKEIYIKSKDKLNVENIKILNCMFPGCQCYPELRYNKIIDKWFCMCSSSMICTKDDDEDELEHPDINTHFKNNTLTEENGFFNNPIKALLDWNKNRALDIIEICNNINLEND